MSNDQDKPAAEKKPWKKKLPQEVIDVCHRFGIKATRIWVPDQKQATPKQRLGFYILRIMEDRYDSYGDVPYNKKIVYRSYNLGTLKEFPQYKSVSVKDVFAARMEARRKFLKWYDKSDAPESGRLNLVREHGQLHLLSIDECIYAYRSIRSSLRKGSPTAVTMKRKDTIAFLEHLARESLECRLWV